MHNINCRFIRLNSCHICIFTGKIFIFTSEHKTSITKLIKYFFFFIKYIFEAYFCLLFSKIFQIYINVLLFYPGLYNIVRYRCHFLRLKLYLHSEAHKLFLYSLWTKFASFVKKMCYRIHSYKFYIHVRIVHNENFSNNENNQKFFFITLRIWMKNWIIVTSNW